MADLRFYPDNARTMGACEDRGCGGVMLVVEDMGGWTWCQCARCHVQAGVGKGAARPPKRDEAPPAPDHSGDAFLGAT